MRHLLLSGLSYALAVSIAVLPLPVSASSSYDSLAYPSLDREEIGHLTHFVKILGQKPGDWSGMDTPEASETHNDGLRYQLANMVYAISLAQHGKVPAYRELYAEAIENAITKMRRQEVWDYWATMSRFEDFFDRESELVEGWYDPVKKKNIMYSGHLFKMVALYGTLYNDPKYDTPGSLTLYWRHGGLHKPEKFEYDAKSLATVIFDQFKEMDFRGVECEPNLIFLSCNQVPILGFMSFDHSHGTKFSSEAINGWMRAQHEKEYFHPSSHVPMYHYEVKQDVVSFFPEGTPIFDPMSPAFQHVWRPDEIKEIYPQNRDRYSEFMLNGSIQGLVIPNLSIIFAHFAHYSAELGDAKMKQQFLDYADQYFNPTWDGASFFYPRNDLRNVDVPTPFNGAVKVEGSEQHEVHRTANIVLAMARLNEGGSLWRLYNEPWAKEFFSQPYLKGIQFPEVLVTQAYYDESQALLALGLLPGEGGDGRAKFSIANLDPGRAYAVIVDGKELGTVKADTDGRLNDDYRYSWSADGRNASFDIPLAEATNIIIAKQ